MIQETATSGLDLRNKRVLLTGASSGIGLELARELGRHGAKLAISARRAEALEDLAAELESKGQQRPVVITADLARYGAAAELAQQARQQLGDVDVLINNAGGGAGGSIWATADDDPAREAFEVNYWSPLALISALLPSMRSRGVGAIVNVSSGAPAMAWPLFGAYAATKAALELATETLRLELMGSGVRVLHVIPGAIDTAVQGETRLIPGIDRMLRLGGLGSPQTLARQIVRALENGKRQVVYPRRTAIAVLLPQVVRAQARRAWRRALRDLSAQDMEGLLALNVRTGTFGDTLAQEARARWQRRVPG